MEPSENTILQNPKPEKSYEEEEYPHDQTQIEDEEDQDEALSLRDLPLNADENSGGSATATATATLSSDHQDPATELFEFLSSTTCDVSPAENIIFRGKLIPLNDQNTLRSDNNVRTNTTPRIRVRSESLPALKGDKLNRSSSVPRVIRNSRSLDHRNQKFSPPVQDRDLPEKGSSPPTTKFTVASMKTAETASFVGKSIRPRWYVIMFGMVKFPPEIALRDIKIRQTRRNIPPVMFPSPGDRISGKSPSSSWRFIKALSCKEPTSVAATAPVWVPHA